MKYLILLVLAFSASANYVKKSSLGDCDNQHVVYSKRADCGVDCKKIDKTYNCHYHDLVGDAFIENTTRKAKYSKKIARALRKKKGRHNAKTCLSVLNLINGWNDENGLDEATVDAFEAQFEVIKKSLLASRPKKALRLIKLITPDGAVVTQEMKDAVINEFKDKGFN